jgi:hypothetical protein
VTAGSVKPAAQQIALMVLIPALRIVLLPGQIAFFKKLQMMPITGINPKTSFRKHLLFIGGFFLWLLPLLSYLTATLK